MNCPNDRYVNDGEICQAVAANLARVGIKVNLQAESKATLLPEDPAPRHELLPARLDPGHLRLAQRAVQPDRHAHRQGPGPVQPGGSLQQPQGRRPDAEDPGRDRPGKKRNAMIAEAFKLHADDVGHIPLHQQALAWAMKKNVIPGAAAGQLHALPVTSASRASEPMTTATPQAPRARCGASSTATSGSARHSSLAGRHGGGRGRFRVRVQRALRAVDRAAQPLRPGLARAGSTPARRRPGTKAARPSTCSAPTTRGATCSRPSCTARACRCWWASRRW